MGGRILKIRRVGYRPFHKFSIRRRATFTPAELPPFPAVGQSSDSGNRDGAATRRQSQAMTPNRAKR